jgi:hypothetical protein
VLDPETGSFYDLLQFSPGRYVDTDGNIVDPVGLYDWTYISTFLWQPALEHSFEFFDLDIAVITYGPDADGALPGQKRPAVTTTGYPGDKPSGSQWQDPVCKSYKEDCSEGLMITDCDVFHGQSGSPVYAKDTVYGVVSFGITDAAGTEVFPASFNGFNMITPHKLLYLNQWAGLIVA